MLAASELVKGLRVRSCVCVFATDCSRIHLTGSSLICCKMFSSMYRYRSSKNVIEDFGSVSVLSYGCVTHMLHFLNKK